MRLLLLFIFFSTVGLGAAETKNPLQTIKDNQDKKFRNKIFSFDFGVGIPQLAALQMQLSLLKRWQFGLSYGMLFNQTPFTPNLDFIGDRIPVATNVSLDLEPKVIVTLSSLCPFIRFFPLEDTFYFQLAYAFIKVHTENSSGFIDANSSKINNASIKGEIDFVQHMPTFSLGALFHTDVFFFNLALGASFITTLNVTSKYTGDFPSGISESDKQIALEKVSAKLNTAAQKGLKKVKNEISFVPSIMLSFGTSF